MRRVTAPAARRSTAAMAAFPWTMPEDGERKRVRGFELAAEKRAACVSTIPSLSLILTREHSHGLEAAPPGAAGRGGPVPGQEGRRGRAGQCGAGDCGASGHSAPSTRQTWPRRGGQAGGAGCTLAGGEGGGGAHRACVCVRGGAWPSVESGLNPRLAFHFFTPL